MHNSPQQTSNLIKVRSITIASFLLLSLLALSSPNVSRVEAAPKLQPEQVEKAEIAGAPSSAPTQVTVSIYGILVSSYKNGFCYGGVQTVQDQFGTDVQVDYGWDASFSMDFLSNQSASTFGRANYSSGAPGWSAVCFVRSDPYSFNLSSVPANAIVQSATLNLYMLSAGANTYLVQVDPFPWPGDVDVNSLNCTCWWSRALPLATVQTWITNRTSGGLGINYSGYTNGWSATTTQQRLDLTYVLDTTPPITTYALSGTSGNNGYYKSAVALALAAVDSETSIASTTLNGSTYSTPLIISTEGTTTHSYYSTDVAGNVEVTKTVSVKIDTVAPATTASLTGLMGLNSWFVGPVSVSLTSTDATSGVASSTLNGSAYTAPVSFSTEGTNSINYFSTDNAGNNETTQNASFKIDTVAPTTTSSLSGTVGTNGWYTSAVAVTLTPTDATSGVGSTVLNSSAYTAPVSFSTQGTNTITYRSTDNAGNSESNQSTSFKIDTVTPSAAITSHTNNQWVGGVVTLSGNASDSTSGVASVEVNIDGAGWMTASGTTGWSTTWNASALPDASSHTIQVRATDSAGNVSSITSFTLQVDNAPPTAELIVDCPAMGNDNWCRDSVTVRLSGSDAGVGVQSLTYGYDGKTETLNATRASFVSGIGGITQVSLYSTDKLNKNSSTQTKEIKIDGGIPTLKFNGGDKSTLNIEVTDGESGLARWTLQVFDSNNHSVYWKELTGEQRGNMSWDGASLLGGTYFVEIFARDNAGLENHLGRTAFNVSLITLPSLFPTATPTIPAPAPRPVVAVVIQATPVPTAAPPIAVAQLPPTNNQPPATNNQPPTTSDQQPLTPKEVTIQIPPTLPPNPVTPLEAETAVPILGMLLGAILAGSFILNAGQRTQMALAILVLLLTLTGGASWLLNRDDPQTLDVPLRMQDPDTVFCGPASLGMAFDFIHQQPTTNNQPLATSDLIQFMKSKNLLFDFGVGVEELAYAARLKGYDGSYYFSDWDITRLKQELHEGRPVLTPIKLDNYKQPVGHFLTVTGFSADEQFVIANDPLKGEVHIPVETFNQAWQANGARGVVVAPKPIATIPDSALPLFAGVGAAAALAGLAALGTARKGLGAGRTDEGEGTWADYSWYQPPASVQDTWFDTQTEPAAAPQDTWFDSRVYDEGPHEQTASAPSSGESSSHGEMTPDAGVNYTPATNIQVTQTTSSGWGEKSDAELMAQAEKEVAQRRKEIKTIEDAQKLAQEEADRAAAGFYKPLSFSPSGNLDTASDLLNKYKNVIYDLNNRFDDYTHTQRMIDEEKKRAIAIGDAAKRLVAGDAQGALELLKKAASIKGDGLEQFLPQALQFSSTQVRAYTTVSFIEGKEVGNDATLIIYQTMLNREKTGRATLVLGPSGYGGGLGVVESKPELFTNVKNAKGETLLSGISKDENAKVVLERLRQTPGGIETLMTNDMRLKYLQAKSDHKKDEWTALNESGAITLIFNPTDPALQEQAKALKQKAKEFMSGVELDKSPEAQQALSAYGLLYATGQAAVTGSSVSQDIGLTLKSTDYPNKPSDAEVRRMVDDWAGVPNLKFTVNPSPTGTGWQVTVKGGTPALFKQSYADAVLLKAGYTLDHPTLFFSDDPTKQQLANNLAKGRDNIFENNISNKWLLESETTKGVSNYQAALKERFADPKIYRRAVESLVLIKGPGVSLMTNAENPNLKSDYDEYLIGKNTK